MKFDVKLNKPPDKIIQDSGVNEKALFFAVSEARRLMNDYVPMRTGALADTAEALVENRRGKVYYSKPYAAFCYYGEKRMFNRDKHQKATAYWDRAMMQTHRADLSRSVENYIKSGGY